MGGICSFLRSRHLRPGSLRHQLPNTELLALELQDAHLSLWTLRFDNKALEELWCLENTWRALRLNIGMYVLLMLILVFTSLAWGENTAYFGSKEASLSVLLAQLTLLLFVPCQALWQLRRQELCLSPGGYQLLWCVCWGLVLVYSVLTQRDHFNFSKYVIAPEAALHGLWLGTLNLLMFTFSGIRIEHVRWAMPVTSLLLLWVSLGVNNSFWECFELLGFVLVFFGMADHVGWNFQRHQRECFLQRLLLLQRQLTAMLELEPFEPETLRVWLESGESSVGSFSRFLVDLRMVSTKELIGSGAAGQVHRAEYENKQVAVKQFWSGLDVKADQNSMLEEVSAELSVLSQLHHVNIIAFYGIGRSLHPATDQYIISFVMEYAANSLATLLRQEECTAVTEILAWASEIADAMSYLHKNNVTHNDLKPENVLLTAHRQCKLCDFGQARLAANLSIRKRDLEDMPACGTPGYMAPELSLVEGLPLHSLRNSVEDATKHCDVFAFGVTMAAMFKRNRPYPRHKSITPALLHSAVQLGWRPVDPARGYPCPNKCSEQMLHLMQRCWGEAPDHRPSFEEVWTTLRDQRDRQWSRSQLLISDEEDEDASNEDPLVCALSELSHPSTYDQLQTPDLSIAEVDLEGAELELIACKSSDLSIAEVDLERADLELDACTSRSLEIELHELHDSM